MQDTQSFSESNLSEPHFAPPQAVSIAPVNRWRALWAVRVPAILTALMALLNVWSAATPSLPSRVQVLWDALPFDARRSGHLTTVLAGFALLLLAQSLWRRKQVAWALTLVALLISALAHLLKGLDYEEAMCALALAVWLWLARAQFHARSDAPSARRGLQVLALAFAFTLAYGTVGFYLLDRHFRVNFNFSAALQQTLAMFTEFANPVWNLSPDLGATSPIRFTSWPPRLLAMRF